MISINRLMMTAVAVLVLAALCPVQADVQATDMGNGAAFKGTKIKMRDKGEAAFTMSFKSGKQFEATADGTKNTDVNLYVYDKSGKEVGRDDSPGPKCSVKITPATDGTCKFVLKNTGGDNTVTFKVKVTK